MIALFTTETLNKITYYAKAVSERTKSDLLNLAEWRCDKSEREWRCALTRNKVKTSDFAFIAELEKVVRGIAGDVEVVLLDIGEYEESAMHVAVRPKGWESYWYAAKPRRFENDREKNIEALNKVKAMLEAQIGA